MTTTARKIVTSKQVWDAYKHAVQNNLTASEVAESLGMKLGSWRQAVNKLKTDFVTANPNVEFPKLRRDVKVGSKVDPTDMLRDLETLTQG